jgi:hypothetical protein
MLAYAQPHCHPRSDLPPDICWYCCCCETFWAKLGADWPWMGKGCCCRGRDWLAVYGEKDWPNEAGSMADNDINVYTR